MAVLFRKVLFYVEQGIDKSGHINDSGVDRNQLAKTVFRIFVEIHSGITEIIEAVGVPAELLRRD